MKAPIWRTATLSAIIWLLINPANAWAGRVGEQVTTSLIVLSIVFVVFLVLREFSCWYSKQNEIVSLLREIRDSQTLGMSKNRGKSSAMRVKSAKNPSIHMGLSGSPNEVSTDSGVEDFCHHCGEPVQAAAMRCTSCGKDLNQDDPAI